MEYEAECNDCDWKGNKDEMVEDFDDEVPFYSCPDCGSEDIYYF